MAKDIVQTATEAGSFKTLLTAVKAAGLVETLQGKGPFTVFAPTDAAFAALPAGTLDGLLKDPAALKKILLYHVVSGAVTADKVVGLTSATSVEGSPIAIAVKDGTVYLNDSAKVVTPDVMASNGVIHVIDKVILPPAELILRDHPSHPRVGPVSSRPHPRPTKDHLVIATDQLMTTPTVELPGFAGRLLAALEHRARLRPCRPGRRRPRARHRLRAAGHGDVHGGAAGHCGRRADHPVRSLRGVGRRPLPPAVGRLPLARGRCPASSGATPPAWRRSTTTSAGRSTRSRRR